ncbi:MAG: hypothetical protein RH860_08740 [Cytophagales bacterium]
MKPNLKSQLFPTFVVILVLAASVWFVADLLFDQPEIHEGVIVEMEFVPSKAQTSQYRLSRSRPQLISGTSHDRWLATVKMKDGNEVIVDCKKHHFDNKRTGDVLRFKEFTGGSLEIKYFAHSEEED